MASMNEDSVEWPSRFTHSRLGLRRETRRSRHLTQKLMREQLERHGRSKVDGRKPRRRYSRDVSDFGLMRPCKVDPDAPTDASEEHNNEFGEDGSGVETSPNSSCVVALSAGNGDVACNSCMKLAVARAQCQLQRPLPPGWPDAKRNRRTHAARRMAKQLWQAKQQLWQAQQKANAKEALKRAELEANKRKRASLLLLVPPLVHWVCVTESHMRVAATMLKQTPSMQRPASVQKLESWLARRGCCKVRTAVPVQEVVAMMLPLLHSLDVNHSLQHVLAPFAGISTNSDMGLASSAATRVVRYILANGDAVSDMGLSDLMGWLCSQSWVSSCVTPAALVAELESHGIIQAQALGGRLHYDDVALVSSAAVQSPAMESNHQVRDLEVKFGPGKVAGIQAKLLRMVGLQEKAAKWADAAGKRARGTVVISIDPAIEFSEGLTLKLQVSVLGLPAAVDTFVSALHDIAVDDIASKFSPPSCTCGEFPAEIAGCVIGKGWRNIKTIEIQHRVCVQVLGQDREKRIIKAWLTPYLFTISGDPAKFVESLAATSQEKFRNVCAAVNSLSEQVCSQQRRLVHGNVIRRRRDQDVDEEQQLVMERRTHEDQYMDEEQQLRREREERYVRKRLKLAAITRRRDMISRGTSRISRVADTRTIRLRQKNKTLSLAQDIFEGLSFK